MWHQGSSRKTARSDLAAVGLSKCLQEADVTPVHTIRNLNRAASYKPASIEEMLWQSVRSASSRDV